MACMSFPALAPLQIGPLRVEWPVFLAPMAGYTDAAFRSLCREMGCGGAVTEMVNAYGYVIGHDRTEHYLDTWEGEHPLGAQPNLLDSLNSNIPAKHDAMCFDSV